MPFLDLSFKKSGSFYIPSGREEGREEMEAEREKKRVKV
jgi:hypothetical protein